MVFSVRWSEPCQNGEWDDSGRRVCRSGVNFINILLAAFTGADPKRAKKDSQIVSLYAFSGSALAIAARRTLMKLISGFDSNSDQTRNGLLRTFSLHGR